MFMYGNDDFHPFNNYKINKVESYGDSHYLRKYPNVLWVMTNLNHHNFTAKRRVYKHYSLKEYDMVASEINEFNEYLAVSHEINLKREEKLNSIRKSLHETSLVDFESKEAVTIIQHEYAIAKFDDEQPVLGTFGAGPCVILSLYDYTNKIAVLAHIDSHTDLDSLNNLFNFVSKESTIADLVGGNLSSKDMCMDIIEIMEKNHITLRNSDIVRRSFEPASFAIDSRTGKIYSPVEPQQLSKSSDFDMRLIIIGFQFDKSAIKKYSPNKSNIIVSKNKLNNENVIKKINLDILEKNSNITYNLFKVPNKKPYTYCGFEPGFLLKKSYV